MFYSNERNFGWIPKQKLSGTTKYSKITSPPTGTFRWSHPSFQKRPRPKLPMLACSLCQLPPTLVDGSLCGRRRSLSLVGGKWSLSPWDQADDTVTRHVIQHRPCFDQRDREWWGWYRMMMIYCLRINLLFDLWMFLYIVNWICWSICMCVV